MYTLKIAHPSDAMECLWQTIEVYEDSAMTRDLLHSPSFEASDGLIVRVSRGKTYPRVVFTGAYFNGKPVDIGPQSEMKSRHRFQVGGSTYGGALSYLEAWKTCNDPQILMASTRSLLSSKRKIMIATALAKKALEYHKEQRIPAKMIECLERWAKDQLTTESIMEFAMQFDKTTGRHLMLVSTILCSLATHCDDPADYITRSIDLSTDAMAMFHDRGYAKRILAIEVRKTIPFHEILLAAIQ